MKAFVSQQAFYFAIAVALVGGSGWVLYSQWFAAETDKVQTENDGETEATTQETVLPESELSVAAPDAAFYFGLRVCFPEVCLFARTNNYNNICS